MSECEEQKYVYADPAAYPPVKVCARNPDYARAMLSNIGSCASEMSAVALYFYNSTVANGPYEEVGRAFRKISMVEMHHLNIYAELAELLGADPRLWSVNRGRPTYWSPNCMNYTRKVDELLKYAYRSEVETITKYEQQLQWIEDEYIQANIKRIILDEKCHLKVFDALYDKYCR